MSLSDEQIKQLLELKKGLGKSKAAQPPTQPRYEPTSQYGPLRTLGGKTVRCCNQKCFAPAKYSVNSVPYCTIHSLYALNAIIVEAGDETIELSYPNPINIEEVLAELYELNPDSKHIQDSGFLNLKRQLDGIANGSGTEDHL